MDSLSTCMICEVSFEKGKNVVVVNDATYLGFVWSDDMASFEQLETPERGAYCTDCYSKLMVYSWKLAKEKGSE